MRRHLPAVAIGCLALLMTPGTASAEYPNYREGMRVIQALTDAYAGKTPNSAPKCQHQVYNAEYYVLCRVANSRQRNGSIWIARTSAGVTSVFAANTRAAKDLKNLPITPAAAEFLDFYDTWTGKPIDSERIHSLFD
ncbi:hypothetical protein [Chthonobacter albigriseus]|uniref:hypothetical protein n=1 Tax=Chthonobacter albigriseus TaxID=1683161 RepID=UPI0015EE5718|nr:hypothetical protein [Chthonobacter albigriseus]